MVVTQWFTKKMICISWQYPDSNSKVIKRKSSRDSQEARLAQMVRACGC